MKAKLFLIAVLIGFTGCSANSLPAPLSPSEEKELAETAPVPGTLVIVPFGDFSNPRPWSDERRSDALVRVFTKSGKFKSVVTSSNNIVEPLGVLRFREKRSLGYSSESFLCPRHPFLQLFTLYLLPLACTSESEYEFELTLAKEPRSISLVFPETEERVIGWASLFLNPFPGWTLADTTGPVYEFDRQYERVLLQTLREITRSRSQ